MNVLLKYSFVVDILGALASIAYGVWADSALWLWGGVAGLAFSIIWRRVQPRLLNALLRKKQAVRPAPAVALPVEPLVVPAVEVTTQADTLPVQPAGRPSIAVDAWHVTPPKDGRLRYY